jgi:transcriptional regulator GlxA family with amidase domain
MTGRASAARNRALRDELLAALARRGLGAATTAADAHPPPIRRALAFLREHASREISLDALAHTAGLSKFHFLRRFAGHLGVTPHRYQLLLRVAHARALLRRGVHIADVAFAAGFYDQSHLTRCFHSVVGVPPRRFQRYDSAPARIA